MSKLTYDQLCQGLDSNELAAFAEHRVAIQDYLSQQAIYCKEGMSLSAYLSSVIADKTGVWTEQGQSEAHMELTHLSTLVPLALQSALAKADRHLPIIDLANPLTFRNGDPSTNAGATSGLVTTPSSQVLAGDPGGIYRAEYAKNQAHYKSMDLSLDEYVVSRRIEDGLDSLSPESEEQFV